MNALIKSRYRVLLAAVGSMAMFGACAAEFPSKPIRLILPAAAGGGTDAIGRVLAQVIQHQSGVTVLVDNKPGAGGSIGVQHAAQAKPDGYTILAAVPDAVLVFPMVNPNTSYRSSRDLTPIAQLGLASTMLVVNGKSSINTLDDLVAVSKKKAISYASPGEGTTGHLVAQAVLRSAGVRAVHIPYKGASPALMSVVSGETDLFNTSTLTAGQLLENGQVKAIAQLSSKRSPLRPHMPILADFGVQGIPEEGWFRIFAPAGVPAGRVEKLIQLISDAIRAPEYLAQAKKLELNVEPVFGDEFRKIVSADDELWQSVVKQVNAKEVP